MRQTGLRICVLLIFLFGGISGKPLKANGIRSKAEIKSIFSSTSRYATLHTAAKEFYLSEDEKLVIALCNLVRYDAKAFIREAVIPSGIDTNTKAFSELLSVLRAHKSVFPLMPAFSLYKSSLSHAKDMGFSGLEGHRSSDGKSFQERIQQHFPTNTGFEENYYKGSGEPLDIVLSMLLGQGEPGNRYCSNILSENLHYIGVAIQPHKKSCTNAVLDFAQKPKITTPRNPKKDDMEVYWKDCPQGTKINSRRKSGSFSLSSIFGGRRK